MTLTTHDPPEATQPETREARAVCQGEEAHGADGQDAGATFIETPKHSACRKTVTRDTVTTYGIRKT